VAGEGPVGQRESVCVATSLLFIEP
jgi:hypothetical protein